MIADASEGIVWRRGDFVGVSAELASRLHSRRPGSACIVVGLEIAIA